MADLLLNKLINREIDADLFLTWLTNPQNEDPKYGEINGHNCTTTDFVSYFLNFLHEQVPRKRQTPIKLNTPKRLETSNNSDREASRRSLFSVKSEPAESFHSTPKNKLLNTTIDNSYMSPVSPLYKNASNSKKGTLCLGDFIVNKKGSGKKKTPKSLHFDDKNESRTKRITPTTLNNKKTNRLQECENSFNFQPIEEVELNSQSQRLFMAEERKKILTRDIPTPKIINTSSFNNRTLETEAETHLVTYCENLLVVVKIYVFLLRHKWVLNVTSEIYFVVSLLLTKEFSGDMSCDSMEVTNLDQSFNFSEEKLANSDIFNSLHNVVFFAVKCLEQLLDLLNCYDKSTLKLLSDNKRLQEFSPAFSEALNRASEAKTERIIELQSGNNQTNICFDLDNDKRENFPNDQSFHSFRKQRDLFYEILRIWENNHLIAGWSFTMSLSGKIKSLLGLSVDPANFMHFSRLFKAQLLTSCTKLQHEEGFSESQVPFLANLPNLDADKLNRLKSRLVTKQSSNGINSPPTFQDSQEFYRDFVAIANHHIFNKHLCDSLINEIIDLNNSKFDGINSEKEVDISTKQSYSNCIKSLRVLAKFLGFIEALPYKYDANLNETVLTIQISLRKEIRPTFDVKTILQNSIQERKLVLIIPWLTKYLAMLDYVTLRTPYYMEVNEILFKLYQNCGVASFNSCLIEICLGWLFELPHFPDSHFFKNLHPKLDTLIAATDVLDELEIIDQNILYTCCPYLKEMKRLLSNNSCLSTVTVKHITPVTAQTCKDLAKKKLEVSLQEAFFNGQPVSVRKTVEFVSERVASTCVKHICNTLVPDYKQQAVEELKLAMEQCKVEGEEENKKMVHIKGEQLASTNLQRLRLKCEEDCTRISENKIKCAIEALAALDTLPAVQKTCITIALKMCKERVTQWTNSHLTPGLFIKEFERELKKTEQEDPDDTPKPLHCLPPGGEDYHNEEALSPAQMIERLRDFSIAIIEKHKTIDQDLVLEVLEETLDTITQRGDINEGITGNMCSLLVDIYLLLTAHFYTIINHNVLLKFIDIWKKYYTHPDALFNGVLSPRNVFLLNQSNDHKNCWESLGKSLAFLVKQGVIKTESFEEHCTAVFRTEWDEVSLKNLTNFMRVFISQHKDYGGSCDAFVLLLEFLSEFCVDL